MAAVFYRSPGRRYPYAVSAQGMYLEDSSGRQYLDMSGGAAVSVLGHGHPDVIDAVSGQVARMAFAHTAFFTNEPQEQLAALLASRFGETGARVYFTSGGSEANECALKLAWQYWQARGRPDKRLVISREHSYHGNTFATLSVSGNPSRRRDSAAPLLEWPRIDPCYIYRYGVEEESPELYGRRAAECLEDTLGSIGAENVAAFICETVVGASLGVVPPAPGYLRRVREICDEHEILFIADEIMCGSGRTGTFFAFEQEGARPDIVTLAKGIAGGYQPLAATIMRPKLAEFLTERGFAHGHTYVGHATACAAGVAVQRVLDRDDLLTRTRETGARFLDGLSERFAGHKHVGDIRGRGLFAGIEFVQDKKSRHGMQNGRNLPARLKQAAMDAGLICYPGGAEIDGAFVPHILLAPPMIIEDRHLFESFDKLSEVIQRVFGG